MRPHTILAVALRLMLALIVVAPGLAAVRATEGSGPNLAKIDPAIQSLLAGGATGDIPVIVEVNPGSAAGSPPGHKAAKLLSDHGGRSKRSLHIIGGASGTLRAAAISALSRNPNVRYIAYDGAIGAQSPFSGDMVDYSALVNAPAVWAMGYTGAGVGVAVLDSGIEPNAQAGLASSRVVASVNLASDTGADPGGHGTHIAGIIGGTGNDWSGIAPGVNIINVRVLEESGGASISTVIAGIQWAVSNRKTYNIRVLNLSLGALPASSYLNDPLAAAAEMAWQAGIVVVAAAGNSGLPGSIHSPGHDPYVLTVGALDPTGTLDRVDDTVAPYSSQGPTLAGQTKPDVVAPGRKVVSLRAPGSYLDIMLPDRVVEDVYFRLSGTSQAAAVASGVAALLIQKDPALRPDEVKYLLKRGALPLAGYNANAQGAGAIDAYRSATLTEKRRDNRGLRPSDGFAARCLKCIDRSVPPAWKDLTAHHGVDSKGVSWDNVTWDNVTWDNLLWDNVLWDNVYWDNVTWDNVTWDSALWDSAAWDSLVID